MTVQNVFANTLAHNPEATSIAHRIATAQTTLTDGAKVSETAASLPAPGERIGQYELIRELGRGGMGAVFLARDTKLGRRVAMKFLHGHNPLLTARFILEARATARCHHENIIVIHDVGEYSCNPYMVLEYLAGAPLSAFMGAGHALPPGRAVALMVPVVRALACAHAHNIVHRDLKPANIFVADSGTVKVLDFGIAKLVQGSGETPSLVAEHDDVSGRDAASMAELTRHGSLVGTIPYMSPEQWGAGTIDHRTDIWAVGIILFSMLAGRHPLWPAVGRQLMGTGLVDVPMPRLRSACPSVPDELAAIVDRCLVKPKQQRMGSARELLAALEALLPGRGTRSWRTDACPYTGLSAFQESDASRFFGRTREIVAAVTRLVEQPLVAVVGPSGAGKSSFVRAGVVPALKRSGETWTSLVIRPGRQPMDALVHLIAPMTGEPGTSVAEDEAAHRALCDRLVREPGYLGAVLRHRARSAGQKVLLFVDQFEELYTLVDDARERLAFTACLASVADDAVAPLRLMVSIRSDFLDRVAEDERFMAELGRALFFLLPPNRQGMRDALVEPAEMAGYQFESEEMIEHILDHLDRTPGALPLLQFAATTLWDTRDRSRRTLTQKSYEQIGGIAGALASHADAVLAELPPGMQARARALLLRLVTPERTRAMVSLDELGEVSQSDEVVGLIEHLVRARLLVVQRGPAGAGHGESAKSVELVHESLIHSWPLLRRWLDEHQDDAVFLDELRSAARQWDKRGRPAGLLWRGEALVEAERWHRRYRGELPAVQRLFLQAVFAQGARMARIRRLAIGTVIVLLSVMVAAAAVALVSIRDAQKEATRQAMAARQAEHQVRAQLAVVEAEKQRRAQAEKRAIAAKDDAEEALARLDEAHGELEQRASDLVSALERAEKARRRARRERKRSQDSAAKARRAEAEARRANRDLTVLLSRERVRVERLMEQIGSPVIEDVFTRRP